MDQELLLGIAFALASFLYASVGHAGASGYLAAMALAGMAPAAMRPTALALNLVVASVALVQFVRAGCFSWRLLWPFALGSVPFAYLGGSQSLPDRLFRILVALGLAVAAARLARTARQVGGAAARPPPWPLGVVLGAGIGWLAGLTGTGGGIYLSPLLVLFHWGEVRTTGGVAAAFILVNSGAALLGRHPSLATFPAALPVWAVVVAGFGGLGAWYGSRQAAPPVFRKLLAAVLVVAAGKLALA